MAATKGGKYLHCMERLSSLVAAMGSSYKSGFNAIKQDQDAGSPMTIKITLVSQTGLHPPGRVTWYRKALGNRTGLASSLNQMGKLFTETGKTAEGIDFNLQSLALILELQVPTDLNLYWLDRQREALGEAENAGGDGDQVRSSAQ